MTEKITHGIKDDEFLRDDVPMTKEEVRAISICKLNLTENAVLYDIGSGTGSVAVEAASCSKNIKVYAVETNPLAVNLINKNRERFALPNIKVVEGMAPTVMGSLPVPTHAFIGGTKGNLKDILTTLYKKNNSMRIVMNAVSLESVSEMTMALKEFPVVDDEVIQVSISKAKKISSYHMMTANNPVFIFSFTFAGKI